ncbi:DUF805 domain-containing protein [Candidatus Pristimantibacillus sp. PTI5]|uniref:DUF805 domain-containing protein n=1 Tax=Candidatus Pristimantibacillus sp. PTI5 TaxID=3400422 RepID=UPI003B018ADB
MQWYLKALKNYVGFTGRARRMEYWNFILFNIIISIALAIVETLVGLTGVLTGLYSLAMLLPSLAVGVRRLHDIGKSGLWLLIGFIPLVGAIVLLVFAFMEGEEGNNQYGPNPKHFG